MAQLTSLRGNIAWWLELPWLPVKIPFLHAVMVQCAELGDISGANHSGGGECRYAYAFPLETIISAGSIVRPSPGLAKCTTSIGGWGYVWTAAPRQVRVAEVNDCMLRQTLCSSLALRCSFWGEPVGGCLQVLKWRLQLQATHWWSHRTSSAVRHKVFWGCFFLSQKLSHKLSWNQ